MKDLLLIGFLLWFAFILSKKDRDDDWTASFD